MSVPSFVILGTYKVKGRGYVYSVVLDRECENFDWLIGKDVLLDYRRFHVTGVDAYAIKKHSRGECVGLLATEYPKTFMEKA